MMQTQPIAGEPIHLRLPPSVQMHNDQFFAFCRANADYRIERNADGEITIMPPTEGETGRRNSDLVTDLNICARHDGTGVVFDPPTGFRLPNGSTCSPDAAWVSRESLALIGPADKDRFLPLAPDFVIELASPNDATDALDRKMHEYRGNGVRLGWLLLPSGPQLRVYRPNALPVSLDALAEIDGGDVLTGFTLDLRHIWQTTL